MKKMFLLLTVLCCLLVACGSPDPSETIAVPTVADPEPPLLTAEPTQIPTDAPTEVPAAVIMPLPITLDINNLDNCTVAVSLEKGGAYVDDAGRMQMDLTVYTYDLYDMLDIAALSGSDTILIRGEEVIVEALDRTENGAVRINGGLDMGGYELWTDENTVYYEIGYSDMKHWQSLGEFCAEVAESFIFTDASDPDKEPVTHTFEDLVNENYDATPGFDPQNTMLTVQDGYIISMERIYTP